MENNIRNRKGQFIKGHPTLNWGGYKSISNSLAKRGNKNPMWGKKTSEKQKDAVRKANQIRKIIGGYGHSISSRIKMSLANKGKHYSPGTEFKGSKTNSTFQKLRWGLKYRLWQVAIYKRDSYTCRGCGERCSSKSMVAHHILSFNRFPEFRYAPPNGVTLCRKCHAKIHNKNAYLPNSDLKAWAMLTNY